jgi:hypothetical protein
MKKLTIRNYIKLELGSHPEFTLQRISEHGNYYYLGIKNDENDEMYVFKISRNHKKYFETKYEVTMTWMVNGKPQVEILEIDKDDMRDYKYFFSLLCEIIKEHPIPSF